MQLCGLWFYLRHFLEAYVWGLMGIDGIIREEIWYIRHHQVSRIVEGHMLHSIICGGLTELFGWFAEIHCKKLG